MILFYSIIYKKRKEKKNVMAIKYNNKQVKVVKFDNNDVKKIIKDGTTI
jgi:hypothetical protein